MPVLFDFSIYTCLRVSVLCRLRWEDLNRRNKTIMVRAREDPEQKDARDEYIPLLGPAWDIVKSLKEEGELLFPYNPRSVSTCFQRSCNDLKI